LEPIEAISSQFKPNQIGSSQFAPIRANWSNSSQLEQIQAKWNWLKPNGIDSSQFKPIRSNRSNFKPIQTNSSQFKPNEADLSQFKQFEPIFKSIQANSSIPIDSLIRTLLIPWFVDSSCSKSFSFVNRIQTNASQFKPNDIDSSQFKPIRAKWSNISPIQTNSKKSRQII
jgi:hypothetical protein